MWTIQKLNGLGLAAKMNMARAQGKQAEKNASNPYAQKSGELWFVDDQDQLYDAWAAGYASQRWV